MGIKRFLTALKITVSIFLIYSATENCLAQQPSQAEQLRVLIWSELDSFPGSFEEADGESSQTVQTDAVPQDMAESSDNPYVAEKLRLFGHAIARAKQVTPFLLSGMLSGWKFDYVPSDRTRRVQEIFEFEEVTPFNREMNPISYRNPEPLDNKLVCWAYCDRTQTQQLSYRRWNSISHPKIRGKGKASVEDEFEGIKKACEEAVKNGVREYWRIYEKNKPKEISGKVLLIGAPRIYISEGQYIADLEFFLETDTIVKYTYY